MDDSYSPSFNNFIIRNKECRSRPALEIYPDTNTLPANLLGVSTFLDANGKYHTVTWANNQIYQYNPATPAWPDVGTCSPGSMQTNTVSYRAFANIIYYTSVGIISGGAGPGGHGTPLQIDPFLGYWDGINSPVFTQTFSDASQSASVAGISLTDSPTVGGSLPGGPSIVGPIAIGAAFLSELNNQLILGNVTIRDQGNSNKIYNFPNLIWWSANGLPLQWDPTQNVSAGFNPFLDVADQITGLAMLGVAGYIFRNYGITQMAPTGSGVNPWEFDHMWASEHGIGNVLPWSIAQYGPTACFIAQDNIYSLSITNAQPIGGKARDAIMTDLTNSTSAPFANIVPILQNGFVYLTYRIYIPFATFIREYSYSFEDSNWTPCDLSLPQISFAAQITGAPNAV